MGHAFLTYLGSYVKVNFFHAWYDNYGIQSAIVRFWLRPLEPAEMRHNVCLVHTMSQFLPVRGVGAKFLGGNSDTIWGKDCRNKNRSWIFTLYGLNRLSPICYFLNCIFKFKCLFYEMASKAALKKMFIKYFRFLFTSITMLIKGGT